MESGETVLKTFHDAPIFELIKTVFQKRPGRGLKISSFRDLRDFTNTVLICGQGIAELTAGELVQLPADASQTNAFGQLAHWRRRCIAPPRRGTTVNTYFTMLVAFTTVCFLAGLGLVIDALRRFSRR